MANIVNYLTRDEVESGITSAPSLFSDQLRQASYRGVPFVVRETEGKFGRRDAIHEYPYRDKPWVEDLGRAARRLHVTGFLVGSDVIAQRDQMIAAVERPGAGELIHPTHGRLAVSLLDLTVSERWDQGRYFEIDFSFVESGDRLYPSVMTSSSDALRSAADALDDALGSDFLARALPGLSMGASVLGQALTVAQDWAGEVAIAVNRATGLATRVFSVAGNFGRFARASLGFLGLGSVVTTYETVQQLIGAMSAARVRVYASAQSILTSLSDSVLAGNADVETGTRTAITSAQSFVAEVRAVVSLTDLVSLSSYQAPEVVALTTVDEARATVSDAMAGLLNGMMIAAAARTVADYQPHSAEDAATVRALVLDVLDTQIMRAGDMGEDDTYVALTDVRSAVIADLEAKGDGLPEMITVTTKTPIPALALAQRLYQDADRAEELVMGSEVTHPAFMPTEFEALSR